MFTSMYTGEGSLGNASGGCASYGFIIFFLFVLWFFVGMNKEDYCNQDARADRIKETAEIEYKNIEEQRSAKEAIMNQASAIRNEQLAAETFDLKLEARTKELQNGQLLIAKDSKIEALQNELSRKDELSDIKTSIAQLACNIPQRPPYYAQGFVTTGQPIPVNNGFCYNGGCGC